MRTRPSSTSTKLACSRVREAKDWARDGRPALRRWGKRPALSSAGDIPRPWHREKQQRRGRAGRPGRVRAQPRWPYWARTPAAEGAPVPGTMLSDPAASPLPSARRRSPSGAPSPLRCSPGPPQGPAHVPLPADERLSAPLHPVIERPHSPWHWG